MYSRIGREAFVAIKKCSCTGLTFHRGMSRSLWWAV